jgi:hypothetical protein
MNHQFAATGCHNVPYRFCDGNSKAAADEYHLNVSRTAESRTGYIFTDTVGPRNQKLAARLALVAFILIPIFNFNLLICKL